MRAPKAYIAGFGTTTVLVTSALLLLAVVSALVAFKGWPGAGAAEDVANLVVEDPKSVDEPVQVALNASPAAAAVASVPAPGTAAAGAGAVTPAGSLDARVPAGIIGGGGGGGGGGFRDLPQVTGDPGAPLTTSEPSGGLLPQTPVSGEVRRLTDGLGDTTQGLTGGLGNAVRPLNPGAGQLLTNAGGALSELLRDLGEPRP